ncbi:MAG TPA: YbhB/YbcL family Raf kinase inhibitor-like protein [Steroidobacteraceae bacterium]
MLEKLPEGLGHALVNQRAGMEKIVYNQLHGKRETARLDVSSTAFGFNGRLPTRYTADGEGMSPPLAWNDCPADAASLAIIVEDADSPTPHPLVHAIVVDIPIQDRSIPEGALNSQGPESAGLEVGSNSFFEHGWLPPDPPPGHGEHRYVFQVFALPAGASFSKAVGRREFINMVLDRAVAAGCLIGIYERSSRPETVSDAALAESPSMA